MASIRHEFYETDERLTISIFDKGADPQQVSVTFESRRLSYEHGDKKLNLAPLKGQIDADKSDYTVGKVKVEIRLAKVVPGRWGSLVSDSPDPLAATPATFTPSATAPVEAARKNPKKNWDSITQTILSSDKEITSSDDPNAGGDAAVNGFFQKLYADADEDTRRAMLKSYQESGGTTLSTNWDEVGKGKVDVKPPEGSEWKKWGA
ncbi:SGS-domain-containing protein [Fomitopsis serialis]|uniref:SGS-domain-containing protein n=1 Tax=Fomitopsis serialis TaxID=139415 RepID=UPI0020080263|nr:SGS-domain-containing protein [Neoantrodia serialis]KAH9919086.1 SGS-domain-containing protein [Neoantrodia serialis]